MPTSQSKLCKICSTPFEDTSHTKSRKFCSAGCRNKAKRGYMTSPCTICGKPTLKEVCFRHTRVTRSQIRKQKKLCWRCGSEKPEGAYLCNRCAIKQNKLHRERRQEIKKEFQDVFGNKCECCGESHAEFLTLDHINGRAPDEKWLSQGSYHKAKKEGYPRDKYRLLCFNCNCARGCYGYCPHEREREQVA